MAENNLTTFITANADFSSLRTQLAAVTAQLVKLQETTVGTNAKLGNQIAVMNKAFAETLRSTGQYSTHFVTLSSDVEKFGKNLDTGKLKLSQYFRVWQDHTQKSGGLIKNLAKQQVMLEQAIVQPLGKNAQGIMQYNVQVAKGLDEIKNKTALARQEASIMNKVMLDGSNQLINWGKNTQWAGRQLTVGLTVPLAAFGAAAQKAFLDANTEMVRLTKVYGGLAATSSSELAKVQKDVAATAKQMASSYGVAYKETIALAADMAATGKQGNDLIASTTQTTRLSVLGEIDRQSAMKATLAIQNTFKQNTDQLTQSIDFLNAVENQTSTSLQDLTDAIPKAGPVIQAMGGSVKDLALYLTAMKEGGIDASSGANALKSALASLVNPTKVATDMFAGFGIDLKGIVSKNAGDLTGTILNLQAALDTLDPLKKQQALEQLFGKFQFARMNALFSNLGKQGSQTLKVMDLMKASSQDLANVSSRELSMMTESASGKYKRALASVQADLAQVGKQFLTISTYVLRIVDGIVKFFDKLPAPIKTALGFLGGLTAVAGPLIMLTGVLGNFVGYVIKGVFHLKSLIKGGQGFKLLTPEIVAAMEAGKGLSTTFYNDAEATNILTAAVDTLTQSFNNLELRANAAKVAMNPAITTVANSVILPGQAAVESASGRVVDKNNPLAGKPYTRQMAHLIPAASEQPGTIFGVVPNPGPVNVRIGKNPQAYMNSDLPKIPGLTSINGVSTGIVAEEAAKWHAMTGALSMQSEAELKVLKTEVNATGTITKELAQSYQALLPEFTTITTLAAEETAAIVAEVQANKISVEAARAKIVALNAEVESMLATTTTQVASNLGRTANIETVPLTTQPAVDANGKSNMKELFHKGKVSTLVDKIARALGGVKTSGAGYSIHTTTPKFNTGGMIENFNAGKTQVSGPASIKYDDRMGSVPIGGYVLNQAASMDPRNAPLVAAASSTYNGGGQITALLTPKETVFGAGIQNNPKLLSAVHAANNGTPLPQHMAGGKIGLTRTRYGLPAPTEKYWKTRLKEYFQFINDPRYEENIRMRMIMLDAAELADHMSVSTAIDIAKSNFDDAKYKSRGSQDAFIRIRQMQTDMLEQQFGGRDVLRLGVDAGGQDTARSTALNRNLNSIRKSMLLRKDFASIKDLIEAVPKTTGINSQGVPYLNGNVRGHLSRRGTIAGGGSRGFFGVAAVMPHSLNDLAAKLQQRGLLPDIVHVTQSKAISDFESMIEKTGLGKHVTVEDIAKTLSHDTRFPSAANLAKDRITPPTKEQRSFTKMFMDAVASNKRWMPKGGQLILRNLGGMIGGTIRRGKNNYGIMNSNLFMAKNPQIYNRSSLGINPENWLKHGMTEAEMLAAQREFAKYPNGQKPTIYNPAKPAGKFPLPGSYYQDLANTDPLHGALQIGRYQGAMGIRSQHVAPRVIYSNQLGFMKRGSAPAFETGTLESRARSALFNYMQGDYAAIDDPAVQSYLSALRTKFTGTLHRGVKHTSSLPPVIRELINAGRWDDLVGKEFIMRRSSWSTNKDTAVGFGDVLLTANVKNRNAVPASQIFPELTFNTPQGPVKVNESEVYMGGKFKVVRASKGHLQLQAVYDAARENGGPVNAGRPYLVGEKGPELFVPKNSGGIIPGYALGGRITSAKHNYGLMGTIGKGILAQGPGLVGSLLGGKLLSSLGVPYGDLIGSIAGWSAGAAAGEKVLGHFAKGAVEAGAKAETAAAKTGLLARAGKLLPDVLKGTVFGISKLNIALTVASVAASAAYSSWKNHKETLRLQASAFGLSAAAAQKAGLKYKDFNQTIKDVMENAKLSKENGKGLFENFASSGTGLNLTITQYKALKKEVQATYADQIKLFNQSKKSDVNSIAVELKTQFMAAGMSAEDATKKIYAMIAASNKQAQSGSATIANKDFTNIKTPKDVGVAGVKGFDTASRLGDVTAQAAALYTAINGIDTGIAGISAEAEKTARAANKTVDSAQIQADAIKAQMEAIGTGHQKISLDLINELAKTNPAIREFASTQDTVLSLWQKIRIEAHGYTGDLTQLNAEQVDALYKLQAAVDAGVAAATGAKNGIMAKQTATLKADIILQEKYAKAAMGQSVKSQISARDQIASLQKQIDANNKLADARLKALDAAKAESDLSNQIAKKQAEYQSALATGNTAQAQQASLDIQGLQSQMQYDAQRKNIQDATTAKNAPLEAQVASLQANQQKLSDTAALASENLSKLNTKIGKEKEGIDNVNTALANLKLALINNKTDLDGLMKKYPDLYKSLLGKLTEAMTNEGLIPKGVKNANDYAAEAFKTMNDAFSNFSATNVTIVTQKAILDKNGGKNTLDTSPSVLAANDKLPKAGDSVTRVDSSGKKTTVTLTPKDPGVRNPNLPHLPASGKEGWFHWNKFTSGQEVTSNAIAAAGIKSHTPYQGLDGNWYVWMGESTVGLVFKDKGGKKQLGQWSAFNDNGQVIAYAKGGQIGNYDGGGNVKGPGTATSDSIPAYLSNGEYVIRASSVSKYGKDFFDGLNTQKFATGGHVQNFVSGGAVVEIGRAIFNSLKNVPHIIEALKFLKIGTHNSTNPNLASSLLHPNDYAAGKEQTLGNFTHFALNSEYQANQRYGSNTYKTKLTPAAIAAILKSKGFANSSQMAKFGYPYGMNGAKFSDQAIQDAINAGYIGAKYVVGNPKVDQFSNFFTGIKGHPLGQIKGHALGGMIPKFGFGGFLGLFAKKIPSIMASSALWQTMEEGEKALSLKWGANQNASGFSKWSRALARVAYDSLQGGVSGLPFGGGAGFVGGSVAGLVEGLVGLAKDGSQFGVKGGSHSTDKGFSAKKELANMSIANSLKNIAVTAGLSVPMGFAGHLAGPLLKKITQPALNKVVSSNLAQKLTPKDLSTLSNTQYKKLVNSIYKRNNLKVTIGKDEHILPTYTLGKTKFAFQGSGQDIAGLAGSGVEIVPTTPIGILQAALKLNPKDKTLKSLLNNFSKNKISDKEIKFLDSMLASVAINKRGGVSSIETTDGFAMLLASLNKNKNAQKIITYKTNKYLNAVKNKDLLRKQEAAAGAGNPNWNDIIADPSTVPVIHSTKFPIIRDKSGNVVLNTYGDHNMGTDQAYPRASLHFTLEAPVQSHLFGQWAPTQNKIVSPLNSMIADNGLPYNLNSTDTWWMRNPGQALKISNSSVIKPFTDMIAYRKELISRGLIDPSKLTPLVAVDPATKEILHVNKKLYGSVDRLQISRMLKDLDLGYSVKPGEETAALDRIAMQLAKKQIGINSNPVNLEQHGLGNTERQNYIYKLSDMLGLSSEIHSGSVPERAESSFAKNNKGNREIPYGRVTDSIEALRMLAANGGFGTYLKRLPNKDDFNWAQGGLINIPKFENGINMVPANMLAMLHKNEAVVPANMNPFNPNANNATMSGATYNITNNISGYTGDINQLSDVVTRKTITAIKTMDSTNAKMVGTSKNVSIRV